MICWNILFQHPENFRVFIIFYTKRSLIYLIFQEEHAKFVGCTLQLSHLQHSKVLHKVSRSRKKAQPKKVLTRRKDEVLCVLEEFGEAEWILEDDVDPLLLPDLFSPAATEATFPVIEDLNEWFTNAWTTDEK